MVKLLQLQEIEVFYVIPALRKELAVCMKDSGKSQKDIAKLLGVTEAAVSQYMSLKRGSFNFNEKIKQAVSDSSKNIVDEPSMMREIQKLLQIVRDERVVCQLHADHGDIPKNCNVCFEKVK